MGLTFGEVLTKEVTAVLDATECYTTCNVRQEAINSVASSSARGTRPTQLVFVCTNYSIGIKDFNSLGLIVIGNVTVNAENNVIAEIEIIACIQTAEEAARLHITSRVNITIELRLSPAIANLTADICTTP